MHKEPGIGKKIANLAGTSREILTETFGGRSLFAPKDVQESRLAICSACDEEDHERQVCLVCGCNMRAKVVFAACYCEKGKWGKWPAENYGGSGQG